MDSSFFAQLEQLELMAFFAGYPLVYAVVYLLAGREEKRTLLKKRLVAFLPYGYALAGTAFLGLQLRNYYPAYSMDSMITGLRYPFLKIWALLSILFWVPAFSRNTAISLLHSLVFFYLLVRDLFLYLTAGNPDRHMVKNEMKVYTDSVLLQAGALAVIIILSSLYQYYRTGRNSRN